MSFFSKFGRFCVGDGELLNFPHKRIKCNYKFKHGTSKPFRQRLEGKPQLKQTVAIPSETRVSLFAFSLRPDFHPEAEAQTTYMSWVPYYWLVKPSPRTTTSHYSDYRRHRYKQGGSLRLHSEVGFRYCSYEPSWKRAVRLPNKHRPHCSFSLSWSHITCINPSLPMRSNPMYMQLRFWGESALRGWAPHSIYKHQ